MAVTKFSSGSSFTNLVKYNDFLAGNDAKQDYWMASLTDTAAAASQSTQLKGVAIDSDGNVYSTGAYISAGWQVAIITKHSPSGTLLWQRALKTANNFAVLPNGIAVDSSNNVYVTGSFTNSSNTYNITFVTKYNTSGTIQWQRTLDNTKDGNSYSIAVDSSANVYITGTFRNASNGVNAFIAKYNTSGTIQWQRALTDTNSAASQSDIPYGITTDPSNNVYVTGYQRGATTFVTKYNSSGTIQWQRFLSVSGFTSYGGWGIDADSSGNVYITGNYYSGGAAQYSIFIAKYNTSGALQWQRTLQNTDAGSAPQSYGLACSVDSAGNVYVTGRFLNASNLNNAFIAKYNTSGTIQFQRRLRDNNATASQQTFGFGITVSSNGIIYGVGYFRNSSNGLNAFITKLPTDGTKTGTYTIGSGQVLVYATLTFTDGAGSQVDSAGNLTDAAASLTDAAGTNVDSANTLTAAVVTI